MVILQSSDELIFGHIVGILGCLLKLSVLKGQSFIEVGDLGLIVFLETGLLFSNYFIDFAQELIFVICL